MTNLARLLDKLMLDTCFRKQVLHVCKLAPFGKRSADGNELDGECTMQNGGDEKKKKRFKGSEKSEYALFIRPHH